MGAYHEFFMRGDLAPQEVANELEHATGVEFTPTGNFGGVQYRANIDSAVVEIEFGHEFENDMGIDFENFPIQVTVRDLERNRSRELATANRIFDRIDSSKLQAQLVYDGQVLIAKNYM